MQVSPDEPDHYSILGVLPDCDAKQLEIAYKALAKKYHPDHSETADLDRFKEITGAYRVLRDPLRDVYVPVKAGDYAAASATFGTIAGITEYPKIHQIEGAECKIECDRLAQALPARCWGCC